MEEDLPLQKALQKAYRLLAARARSEKELCAKLKGRGFTEPVLRKVTAKLAEMNYLDDEAFAGQWARDLVINKLYGNRRIEISLKEKGIPDSLIERAIETAREELTEKEAIEILIRKKADRRKSAEMDIREKHRIYQWLIGRGFAADLVMERLREF